MSKQRKKCIAPDCMSLGQSLGKEKYSTRCKKHRRGADKFVTLEGRVNATLGKKEKKKPNHSARTFRQGIGSLKDTSPRFFRP